MIQFSFVGHGFVLVYFTFISQLNRSRRRMDGCVLCIGKDMQGKCIGLC